MPLDAPSLAPHGYFVTGTDTGVGKTLIACALLHSFGRRGRRVIGMKPVAAGAAKGAEGLINEDVALLRAAGNVEAPLALINPYCFVPPIAPHIAARKAGICIEINNIVAAFTRLATMADIVIVEGVGGFSVPLNDREDSGDLARCLGMPVILVVGVRLGCLNHSLLTAQVIRARGLTLAGWVANRIDPAMACGAENITALGERLSAPLLGEIEFAVAPDPQRIADMLDSSSLG